jgi:hypothetical protein
MCLNLFPQLSGLTSDQELMPRSHVFSRVEAVSSCMDLASSKRASMAAYLVLRAPRIWTCLPRRCRRRRRPSPTTSSTNSKVSRSRRNPNLCRRRVAIHRQRGAACHCSGQIPEANIRPLVNTHTRLGIRGPYANGHAGISRVSSFRLSGPRSSRVRVGGHCRDVANPSEHRSGRAS